LYKNTPRNIMPLSHLQKKVNKIKEIRRRKGISVSVFDIITNKTVMYTSKKEAARAIKADESTFHNNRTNLFRRRYKISIFDKH
jgi:hypothetical protein